MGGSIGIAGDDALSLEKVPAVVQAIGDAAKRTKPDVILLCHGGPIATPKDAAYVLERCDAVGFVGVLDGTSTCGERDCGNDARIQGTLHPTPLGLRRIK